MDQYLFLENTKDQRTQDFITAKNEVVEKKLTDHPEFKNLQSGILDIMADKDKIPGPSIYGQWVYTTWRDEKNPQGIIRRIGYQDYLKFGVKDSLHAKWDVLLDLDALGKAEKKTWVLKGYTIFPDQEDRMLLKLSNGGKDASFLREYDLKKKKFIAAKDGGFYLPENKFYYSVGRNGVIHVSTTLPGDLISSSGYPINVKEWKRHQKIEEAKILFQGQPNDLWSWSWIPRVDLGFDSVFVSNDTFYTSKVTFYKDKKFFPLNIDTSYSFKDVLKDKVYFNVKKEVDGFSPGDIVSLKLQDVFQGQMNLKLVFHPQKHQSVERVFSTPDHLFVVMGENVVNKLYRLNDQQLIEIPFPPFATISVAGGDHNGTRNDFFVYDESFLRPYGIYHIDSKQEAHLLRSKKKLFASQSYMTEQLWATSKDGTKVPYFVIRQKDMPLNRNNPVWIYAYGGFESSMAPWYSGTIGKYWLKKGGVFVVANIRGGGEFGPNWHRQALKENRFRTYDDYFAIAEDLIQRQYTQKGKIGISGGSNGGLLTGVGLTQRPDLYGAVISSAPLLDMFRYHKLPPGDSWVAEYGNVEKNEKVYDFWSHYSPYQNVSRTKDYPPTLIMTSSSDDRVHPGHARKMAAKMFEYAKPVLFFENVQGGHAGSANLKQTAKQAAYKYVFFYENLMN